MKFRKKPIEVRAIQWTGDNIAELKEFMKPQEPVYMAGFKNRDEIVGIETLEGLMIASMNDWIIRGVKGEFYPCKPDVFEATYERVDDPKVTVTLGPVEKCEHVWGPPSCTTGQKLCQKCLATLFYSGEIMERNS